MFMISKTKLDNSFPVCQFLIKGYSSPFVLNMDSQGGGIMSPVLENIPSNFLTIEPSSEVSFLLKSTSEKENGYYVAHITQIKRTLICI